MSPELQVDSLQSEQLGKPLIYLHFLYGKKQTFNVTFLHKPQGPENTFQKKNLFEFYTRKKMVSEYFQLLICTVIKKALKYMLNKAKVILYGGVVLFAFAILQLMYNLIFRHT